MNPTRTHGSRSSAGSLVRRVADLPKRISARRDHDAAMSDPRVAAEHASQIAYSTSRGKPGCEFCS